MPRVNCGCDQGGDGQNDLAGGGAEVGGGGSQNGYNYLQVWSADPP